LRSVADVRCLSWTSDVDLVKTYDAVTSMLFGLVLFGGSL
jgi:hypothetical protein